MLDFSAEFVAVIGRLVLYSSVTYVAVRLVLGVLPKPSPRLAYALWGLVLLRLLLPPDLSMPVSARSAFDRLTALAPASLTASEHTAAHDGQSSISAANPVQPLVPTVHSLPDRADPVAWPQVLGWAWLLGFTLVVLFTLRRWRRVQRVLAKTEPCRSQRATALLDDWTQYFGIRRTVRLRITDLAISPFTVGLFHPRVILPSGLVSGADPRALEAAIAHELAHVKRFDALRLGVRRCLESIWFFHPVVWWTVERIDLARESLCDQIVIARGSLSQRDYARSLLYVVRSIGTNNAIPQAVPALLGPQRRLHMRIDSILNSRIDRPSTPYLYAVVAAIVGLLLLPMAGTDALAEADEMSAAGTSGELTGLALLSREQQLLPPAAEIAYSRVLSGSEYLIEIESAQERERLRAVLSNISWTHPLPEAKVSSTFGFRRHPETGETKHHDGLDLVAPLGTVVRAAGAGRVLQAQATETGDGTVIVIRHGDGLVSKYTHLGDLFVAAGDKVLAGEAIGTVGLTGYTTGPHLHFEVRHGGKALDPAHLLHC